MKKMKRTLMLALVMVFALSCFAVIASATTISANPNQQLSDSQTNTDADRLQIVDGMTGEVIAKYDAEQVASMDITKLAYDLNCDVKTENGVKYLFAGWFTAPQTENDWDRDSWTSKSVAGKTLQADGSVIYAWYIHADYAKLTIAYTSRATRAASTFMLSTVPGDIFNTYGHVMSTAPSAGDSNLYKGAIIDGLRVRALEKKTIYTYIAVAPFSAQTPKTANCFNGGLGGSFANDTDGYIACTQVSDIPVNKTVSARFYFVTLEGTIIYGSTAQSAIVPYANVTGLEG